MKTRKTVAKRIKITAGGKLLKRKGGQNHFNSRDAGKITRKKRRDLSVSGAYMTTLKLMMPNA